MLKSLQSQPIINIGSRELKAKFYIAKTNGNIEGSVLSYFGVLSQDEQG